MIQENKIVFSLPAGLMMGGITTWSVKLVHLLNQGGHLGILVKHTPYPGYSELVYPPEYGLNIVKCPGENAYSIQKDEILDKYQSTYRKLLPATFVPNWSPAIYSVCASLATVYPQQLRLIGIAHSDETYYYDTLYYYESIIYKFIADSEEIRHNLVTLLPHRKDDIVFQPHPVDIAPNLERNYSLQSDKPIRIVYAGRLYKQQKRIFDLVTLVRILTDMEVHFILSIYGDGPDENELHLAMQSLGPKAANHVEWGGLVPVEVIKEVLQNSDILVLVSEYEGMSLSMLEAMSNGCIPIVTKVSGTNHFIRHGYNGYVVEIGNISDMANLIRFLELHRDVIANMGQRSYETVLQSNTYDLYLNWFLELCECAWEAPVRVWPKDRSIYM